MTDPVEHVDSLAALPPRDRQGHKGDYGRVLVVGGSRGMVGAVALAANAALRGGAGLATLAAPETVQLAAATLCPCATSVPLACGADGQLSAGALRQFRRAAERADAVAVGPGMAVGARQQEIVRAALGLETPVVLDADGLNALAAIDDWPSLRAGPLVLTPHPGEFARLTGRSVGEIQAARESAAVAATRDWAERSPESAGPLVLLLKGAGTVVTDGLRVRINETGNPGMATGGSGDVLTGLVAALLAQQLGPFDAASLGAHLHGLAGDLAARDLSQPALIATDLLDYLLRAIARHIG